MKALLIFFLLMVVSNSFLFGQEEEKIDVESYIPTEKTDPGSRGMPRDLPRRKKYRNIYVSKLEGTLYGNPCAIEETHRMGFEYVIEPISGQTSKSRTGKFINNFWVKTKLVLFRSPFWKAILNKRFKRCRNQSGDFVG